MTLPDIYHLFMKNPVVCTDTRKLSKGCLFFALKGDNFNGNQFANHAIEEGAAYAIIDEPKFEDGPKTILVQDVLVTLQQLAQYHRKQLNLPVIAIVGSNGKTSTKELIGSVLQTRYKILSTPGNFNNHIGLPLTLLLLDMSHEIAVIEMGANHEKENAFLCEIACPSHGVVTNNGKDHLEGFGDMQGVIRSNAELYTFLQKEGGIAFVNGNDAVLMDKSSTIQKRVVYQNGPMEILQEDCIQLPVLSFQPTIRFQLGKTTIQSSLSGDYNFDNILAAISFGFHFGLTEDEIKKGIEGYEPKNLRSQLIEKEHNKIFLDAYNANPSSMEASIRNFSAMPGDNKMLILGDMFELGIYEAEEHQLMVQFCEKLGLKEVILVGEAFSKTQGNYLRFESTALVEKWLKEQALKGKFIFLKGSRGMKMESLADCF